MSTQKCQKNAKEFICELCDFICSKESNFKIHLSTSKHQLATKSTEKSQKNATCFCDCGKKYKDRSGLWRHKKKCEHIREQTMSISSIDKNVVDTINNGQVHIVEPELDKVVSKVVKEGFLKASINAKASEVFLIVVPTPFRGNHEPDISFVEAATKSIIPLLEEGNLYIIESTSPIGTTEKMEKLIF